MSVPPAKSNSSDAIQQATFRIPSPPPQLQRAHTVEIHTCSHAQYCLPTKQAPPGVHFQHQDRDTVSEGCHNCSQGVGHGESNIRTCIYALKTNHALSLVTEWSATIVTGYRAQTGTAVTQVTPTHVLAHVRFLSAIGKCLHHHYCKAKEKTLPPLHQLITFSRPSPAFT